MGRSLSSPAASSAGAGTTVGATANYTAVAGDVVLIDTATNAAEITITLPATPSVGDRVNFIDAAGNCGTVKAVIARNSNKIANIDDDVDFDIKNASLELIYTGSSFGWSILSN